MRNRLTILSVSGFRGVVGLDLDLVKIVDISRVFGRFIKEGSCAISRDTRRSGDMVSRTVVSSLLEAGCDVLDLGIASTPALFREVARRNLKGGLMVTASHNPPEWNGLKFVVEGGRGIFEEELTSLLSSNVTHLMKVGRYSEIFSKYPEDLVSYIGKESCSGVRVALDLGGGVGSLFAPKVFRWLGCRVTTVNDAPGIFSRTIDPTLDSLADLSEQVIVNGCDAGFAYDCDADRVVMVDEKGRKLSVDLVLMLCIEYLMEKRGVRDIVASIDTSMGLEDLVSGMGGRIFYSKVGEANVVREMMERGCKVGGEGSSGGLIIADFVLCRDGTLASSLASMMIRQEGSLSDLIEGLPHYHQIREKIPCGKENVKRVLEALSQDFPDADTTDGIKLKQKDSWVLIRPSRTEDVLRVSVEATSKDRADGIMRYHLNKIKNLMEDIFEI
ncbi:MAG: phosphomannomutase [Nitrososphaerales archaeon]|nr:phosphomannomutase [Nitrososphaerales archaeon]